MPSSDSAPCWSRIVRESIFDDTWNAMRVGTLALMRPVITSTDGRCVARIRWMPAARAFCAIRAISSSTFLPTTIIRSASSSITTTMLRQPRERFRLVRREAERVRQLFVAFRGFVDLVVVAGEVTHAELAHQLVAALHFGDRPVERVAGLAHVGDHRAQQMRNAFVDAHFEHLRVDQDHADLGRRSPCRAATGSSR